MSSASTSTTGMSNESKSDQTELGDGREKRVSIVTTDGEEITHNECYLRHSNSAFVVSSDDSFASEQTTRYTKDEIFRIEVDQHHSRCFITTAVANEDETLQTLRDFRDDVFRGSVSGRLLIQMYETVSPSIAATLAQHPQSRTTSIVRGFVRCCANIARYRATRSSVSIRFVLSLSLTILYILGIALGFTGHIAKYIQAEKPEFNAADS